MNFNSLNDAEKFYYTKQMLRARDLVQALRPELSPTSKDMVIARKLSRDLDLEIDVEFVQTCRSFAQAKTDNPDCTTSQFDNKKNELVNSLKEEYNSKLNEVNKLKKDTAQKESDFENKSAMHKKSVAKKKGAKFMFWSAIAVIGFSIVTSFSAIISAVSSFALGLSLLSAGVYGLGLYIGYKFLKSFLVPTAKNMYKSGFDSLNAKAEQAGELSKTSEKELVTVKTAEIASLEEFDEYKRNISEQLNTLNKYKENSIIDNNLMYSIDEIKNQSTKHINEITDSIELTAQEKNEKIKAVRETSDYYIGKLYYEVSNGIILEQSQLNEKFEGALAGLESTSKEIFANIVNTVELNKKDLQELQISEGVR